ncbi:MAG TPA: glycosyltransferase [Mariniphaga sp.]|nr:glycosyltransferase [Mariniphaga sp.]
MELSIIIVNYNVKHFLEQCLHSVLNASKGISSEIFVVDNNSVDGSVQLVKEKFPQVKIIENEINVGFSKANNQAIRIATGKYILLLNPDTVVEEHTFSKVVQFMEQRPETGGLGVKMIDGKGNFLPESKRGLPTPWVAFYKMFGLSALFPRSKRFGKYHLTYLDKSKIHEVDVLAGAFMLLRREVLDKVGMLDENFFMYGEDIDLSYRITKGGYKNYYFPETTIIHYKGESTKKGTLNYVKVFYSAMIIFAQKHFSSGKANTFSFLLQLAIWFRAILSVVQQAFEKMVLPIADALLMYGGYLFMTPLWENFKYEPSYYPPFFMNTVVPVYIFIWLTSIGLSGGYKRPVSLYLLLRGVFWGTITILLIYSLVGEDFRFSRALILMGTIWAAVILVLYRLLFHWLKPKRFRLDLKNIKRIAIVGHLNEATRVKSILKQTRIKSEFAGFISLNSEFGGEDYLGPIHKLSEIVRINGINEIIFCAENIPSADIIHAMLELSTLDVDFKIAPPESISIIGSNSIHTSGDLYVIPINSLLKPGNRRKKRFFDIAAATVIIFLSPAIIWLFKRKLLFYKNVFDVLWGKKSWIGYTKNTTTDSELPDIKPGILSPADIFPLETTPEEDADARMRLNMLYARNYSIMADAEIVAKGWRKLDK